MDLTDFYSVVQAHGQLRSEKHAHRWTTGVLKTLGTYLDKKTKKSLANALPDELGEMVTAVFWLFNFPDTNVTSWEFQNRVARRSGNSDPQFARIPTIAVFGAIKQYLDGNLNDTVSDALSPEVRELWHQADKVLQKVA